VTGGSKDGSRVGGERSTVNFVPLVITHTHARAQLYTSTTFTPPPGPISCIIYDGSVTKIRRYFNRVRVVRFREYASPV